MNALVPHQQDQVIGRMIEDMRVMGVFPPQDPTLVKNAIAMASARNNCPIPPAMAGKDYKFAFVRGNYAGQYFARYRPENTTVIGLDGLPHQNTVNAVPLSAGNIGSAWDFVPANGVPLGQAHPVTIAIFVQDPTGSCGTCARPMPPGGGSHAERIP
jgi:hypothetical protein